MVKVYVETLGCRLNQYESDAILSDLLRRGQFRFAELTEKPELAIVNTCTVTNSADSRNRYAIQRIRRLSPEARIIVTGCQAQTDPEKLMAMAGVHVVPGQQKSSIPALIAGFVQNGEFEPGLPDHSPQRQNRNDRAFAFQEVLPQGHTRAYVKIQDGCDRKCSYCKIPQARGRGVTRSAHEVLAEVEFLQERGVSEVILTGVNLGWYRDRDVDMRFCGLLEGILSRLQNARLRLSSIEPCDVGAELAELFQHPAFCKYLHVPLQSGSDAVLRRMRRTYNARSFRLRIEHMKRKNPDLFLGTDVIVGFPGESRADFEATFLLLKDLGFARIHAFPFSVREKTEAAGFADFVPDSEKKERVARLRELELENWQRYATGFVGRTRQAIVEGSGQKKALADNYLRWAVTEDLEQGSLFDFQITGIAAPGLMQASLLQKAAAVRCLS